MDVLALMVLAAALLGLFVVAAALLTLVGAGVLRLLRAVLGPRPLLGPVPLLVLVVPLAAAASYLAVDAAWNGPVRCGPYHLYREADDGRVFVLSLTAPEAAAPMVEVRGRFELARTGAVDVLLDDPAGRNLTARRLLRPVPLREAFGRSWHGQWCRPRGALGRWLAPAGSEAR